MVACRIPALIRDGGRGHAKQAKNPGPGVGGNERTLMFPLKTEYFMRRNFIFCQPCRLPVLLMMIFSSVLFYSLADFSLRALLLAMRRFSERTG